MWSGSYENILEVSIMMELEKIAKRIASLRRERGYTGEALAERLQVSPQATSKATA